jgi:hypothetical protein
MTMKKRAAPLDQVLLLQVSEELVNWLMLVEIFPSHIMCKPHPETIARIPRCMCVLGVCVCYFD